jgi:NodT family efflux transporter outer membrane factor (OMF) lipoprotein
MRGLAAAPALAAILLAACATPDAKPQVSAIADASLGLSGTMAPDVDGAWWAGLGDPQLDRIMQDALAGNPGLDAALARLREARSFVSVQRAAALPQIGIDADEQRTRFSEKYIIPPPYGGSTRWMGQAEANLGWNLDFWGKQADAVAQARASAQASALDYAAARLALTGAVAQTYVELARAERQIAIAQANLAQRDKALQLVHARIRSQLASDLDVRAAETLAAQARQASVQARGQRELLLHALAMLAGRGADYYGSIQPTAIRFDAALPLPDVLPADLISRRPDIMAALARIESAQAGRELARKAFYPDINLKALIGTQAIGLGNLFTSGAVTYGAGAAIHLPIFEGGRLRAEHEGATARLDASVAAYNETVLGAVLEAADALALVENSRAELGEQRQALNGLTDVTRLNRVRVASGLDSRLDLIGPDIQVLQAQQNEANLQAQTLISAIRLVTAIGGGFDRANPLADAPNSSSKVNP